MHVCARVLMYILLSFLLPHTNTIDAKLGWDINPVWFNSRSDRGGGTRAEEWMAAWSRQPSVRARQGVKTSGQAERV